MAQQAVGHFALGGTGRANSRARGEDRGARSGLAGAAPHLLPSPRATPTLGPAPTAPPPTELSCVRGAGKCL